MWEAVFADVGVALIAIMNAMRIIKNPIGTKPYSLFASRRNTR